MDRQDHLAGNPDRREQEGRVADLCPDATCQFKGLPVTLERGDRRLSGIRGYAGMREKRKLGVGGEQDMEALVLMQFREHRSEQRADIPVDARVGSRGRAGIEKYGVKSFHCQSLFGTSHKGPAMPKNENILLFSLFAFQ